MCDTVGCDRRAAARGLCQSCYQRQWHARHPGYRAHAAAEWRKANPLQVVVHNVARRKRRVCERCGVTFTTGS